MRNAGLRRGTVSLDGLDDATFEPHERVSFPVAKALDGIPAAAKAELAPIKVNIVIERGTNDGQILPVARCFLHRDVAARFIEFIEFIKVGGADSWNLQRVIRTIRMSLVGN